MGSLQAEELGLIRYENLEEKLSLRQIMALAKERRQPILANFVELPG